MIVDRQTLDAMRQRVGGPAQVDLNDLLRDAAADLEAERFAHAEELLQRALVADPDHAPTWALVGRLADDTGDIDVARTAYASAVALAHDPRSALALAQLHASIGEWDAAVALTEWLTVHCDDAEVRGAAAALTRSIGARRGTT